MKVKVASPKLKLCIVAFLWGISFPLMKVLLDSVGVFEILAVRFGVAALFVFLISKNKNISKSSLWSGVKLGSFLFAGYALQTWGLHITTSIHGSFIVGSVAVFVALLNLIFRSGRPSGKTVLRIFLMLLGLALLTGMDFQTLYLGDLFQVIAAILFAIQIILVSDLTEESNLMAVTTAQMLTVSIFSFFSAVIFTSPSAFVFTWFLTFQNWAALLVLGVLATGWTFLAQIEAQQRVKPTEAAVLLSAEPVWGVVASVIVLNESISLIGAIGGVIIFVTSLPQTKGARDIFLSKPR